ncbi:hypothetical protein T4B_10279 [Trichinella pseudospiralis]|uniref:Uncharacterized protein n=1 Tax=Trichinella pseudospiralis TaxID=6337 RepID=A0A0V1JEY1_TRIPS|nr:hypothetical protein T4B_10279 [Trichinella pseudospiralis]
MFMCESKSSSLPQIVKSKCICSCLHLSNLFMQLFFSIMEAASSDVFSAASLSSRSHDVSMWSMCPGGSTENASDGHDARLQAGMMRYQTSHGNYELSQSALGVILSTLQQLQTRIDSRFDSLERRVMNIERGVNSIQKQQQAAMNMKKRKRCCSPLLMDEKPFIETTNSFNGSILDSLPCLSSTMSSSNKRNNGNSSNSSSSSITTTTTHSNNNNNNNNSHNNTNNTATNNNMLSNSLQHDGIIISTCSSKTLSEFMKSAQMSSALPLQGQCAISDGGYIVTNVVDEQGSCHSYKFPASVVEKMLKDNPPEPSGWAASKALVSLLDYVYHPLELAMRRLPALPASNSLSSNLQGRQKSELFVGTQYETGIEFPPDRLLPCCKLIEHYYPGWKFKAFERNHAFREIVHKKCRTRRRDLKQYLLTCGKTKEQALDSIIKGIDLPPREYLGK